MKNFQNFRLIINITAELKQKTAEKLQYYLKSAVIKSSKIKALNDNTAETADF